jgi:phytanoyl-CoA hydroxylase
MQSSGASVLTDEQRVFWDANGYLILSDVVTPADADAVLDVVDRHWRDPGSSRYEIDLLTGPDAGRAYKLADAPEGARNQAYKLNNLFALEPEVRRVALAPKLQAILTELMDGEPMICNSLNFERGSQQDFHIDSWYMPPPDDIHMVAASIALEDVDGENGPIAYYAGSHLIPPYRFSDGRLNETPAEAGACRAYLDEEIAQRGLVPTEVRAKKGDIFLWHGQLLHGGRPIRDFSRTRNSLVVHYWREQDVPDHAVRHDTAGAYLGHTLRGELQY